MNAQVPRDFERKVGEFLEDKLAGVEIKRGEDAGRRRKKLGETLLTSMNLVHKEMRLTPAQIDKAKQLEGKVVTAFDMSLIYKTMLNMDEDGRDSFVKACEYWGVEDPEGFLRKFYKNRVDNLEKMSTQIPGFEKSTTILTQEQLEKRDQGIEPSPHRIQHRQILDDARTTSEKVGQTKNPYTFDFIEEALESFGVEQTFLARDIFQEEKSKGEEIGVSKAGTYLAYTKFTHRAVTNRFFPPKQ